MIACFGLPKNERDWFFTELDYDKAKAICRTCPVKQRCLETVLEFETYKRHGVWGETTPEERDNLYGPLEE